MGSRVLFDRLKGAGSSVGEDMITLNLYALRLADFGLDNEVVPVTQSQLTRSAAELEALIGQRSCLLLADTSFRPDRAATMAAMLVLSLGLNRPVKLGLSVRFDEVVSSGRPALADFLGERIREWGVRDLVLLTHLTVISELAKLAGAEVWPRWGETMTAPAEPQLFRFRFRGGKLADITYESNPKQVRD